MAFADLFELDPDQRKELADHYAYRFRVAPTFCPDDALGGALVA